MMELNIMALLKWERWAVLLTRTALPAVPDMGNTGVLEFQYLKVACLAINLLG